jgi:hypothetical protein
MSGNDEDRGKIRRLSAENQGMIKHKSGYLVAERSGGRVTPCAIRIVYVEET